MEYVQGKTVRRFTKRLRDRKLEMPLGLVLLIGREGLPGAAVRARREGRDGASRCTWCTATSLRPTCASRYKGDVKIIDFGAAQSTLKEEQTAPRVVIGNLTYMAPEQAKKQIVDRRRRRLLVRA